MNYRLSKYSTGRFVDGVVGFLVFGVGLCLGAEPKVATPLVDRADLVEEGRNFPKFPIQDLVKEQRIFPGVISLAGDALLLLHHRDTMAVPVGRIIQGQFLHRTDSIHVSNDFLLAGPTARLVDVGNNGDSFLVLWHAEDPFTTGSGPLRGSLLANSGELLDAHGFLLEMGEVADVASDGTDFFVVATTNFAGGEFRRPVNNPIIGLRVSSTGEVLDDNPIPISSRLTFGGRPNVAWCGDRYFVVWADGNASLPGFFYAWVSKDGEVLAPGPVSFGGTNGSASSPSVETVGEHVVLIWSERGASESLDTKYFGVTISPGGDFSVPVDLDIGGSFSLVKGRTRLTAWVPIPSGGYRMNELLREDELSLGATEMLRTADDLVGAVFELSSDGAEGENPILPSRPTPSQQAAKVASIGSQYLMVWIEDGAVKGLRMNGNGMNLDETALDIGTLESWRESNGVYWFDGDYDVAASSNRFLVVWEGRGRIIGADGALGPVQTMPASAIESAGTNYLVVSSTKEGLQGRFLDENGVGLGEDRFALLDSVPRRVLLAHLDEDYYVLATDQPEYSLIRVGVSKPSEVLDSPYMRRINTHEEDVVFIGGEDSILIAYVNHDDQIQAVEIEADGEIRHRYNVEIDAAREILIPRDELYLSGDESTGWEVLTATFDPASKCFFVYWLSPDPDSRLIEVGWRSLHGVALGSGQASRPFVVSERLPNSGRLHGLAANGSNILLTYSGVRNEHSRRLWRQLLWPGDYPRLENLQWSTENGTAFDIVAPELGTVRVESSEDLRDWVPLSTIKVETARERFWDTASREKTLRFYRATPVR